MKLICVREPGYQWVSTPADAVIRELKNLGHKIFITESPYNLPVEQYDWTLSFYEHSAILGNIISRLSNTPHFCHIETIPPWRYFYDCDVENYGLTKDDQEVIEGIKNRPMYERIAGVWSDAKVHTLSNHSRIYLLRSIVPQVENIQLRYPSIDTRSIEKFKKMYSPKIEQNVILTVSRATKIKRFDLILKVSNEIKTPNTVWKIVGNGPALKDMQDGLKNPNVKISFLGGQFGWSRFFEMAKANVFISAMGGMPPIEAALLGCSSFGIEQEPTLQTPEFDRFMEYNFGKVIPIFKHNQYADAAQMIDESLQGFGVINSTYNTVDRFMSLECNVLPSVENAKQIIERIK